MDLARILCGLVVLCAFGCTPLTMQSFSLSSLNWHADKPETDKKKKDKEDDDEEGEFSTKVKTPLIGEHTQVAGLNMIVLQGVGLITGLDGTGGDPKPSMYRTQLLEDMRKRGVKNPNEILKSPNTALVVVRAYLPPLIEKGEKFDVEVRAVDGSEITSLNGGWLMKTHLSEQAIVPGRGVMQGHEYATAEGHVLVGMSNGDQSKSEDRANRLLRGRVVAGGTSKTERNLTLYLRNDFRSRRNSVKIAERIGDRFYEYNESGQRKPLAEAKTDQQVELKVLSKYKDNFPRYLQVIRNIAYRESPVALQVRMRDLKDRLLKPSTAEDAAIKLEAIGEKAVPVLKAGLQSPSLEVRFHAAMALAYLGQPEGLGDLAKAVREEPAFRVFGLAAMAAIEDAESHMLLRELMNENSAETRYGAFRALTTLDKNDPFVRGESMREEFRLHVLDTTGPPLIHLTNRRKAEIVLFGADQRLKIPFVARAGLRILVTAEPGSETVTVSRFEVGRPDEHRTVSSRVADVIRACVEMNASYPDVAGLLAEAGAQQSLAGRIEIDALPQAGRVYMRPAGDEPGSGKSRSYIGNSSLVPNLFSSFDESAGSKKSQGTESADDADPKSGDAKDAKSEKDSNKKPGDKSSSKADAKSTVKEKENGPDHEKAPAKAQSEAKSKTGVKDKTGPVKPAAHEETNDEEDPSADALMKSTWSWNPLRLFQGIGQREPDVDADTPAPKKSAAKPLKSEDKQSEP